MIQSGYKVDQNLGFVRIPEPDEFSSAENLGLLGFTGNTPPSMRWVTPIRNFLISQICSK